MTIIDDTPPVITCPAAIVIECSDELDPSINLALGEATATDNCDDDIDITIGYADISGPGSCIGESVITRHGQLPMFVGIVQPAIRFSH